MIPGNPRSYFTIPFFVLALYSCHLEEKTVSQRIAKNPTLFNTKSFTKKKLITSGVLAPGMTRDDVYLSWGNPKSRSQSVENGVAYEQWAYQTLKPKVDFDLGFENFGLSGPNIGLERSLSKTVRFENGRVTGYRTNN